MSKSAKARIKGVAVPIMAWTSFGCAFLAGAFAPGMWIGHWIAAGVKMLSWFVLVIFFSLLAWTIRDLAMDGEPNKIAVYSVIVLPSLAGSTPGGVGQWVADRSHDALTWASQPLHDAMGKAAVGKGAPTVMTLVLLGVAIAFAQRTVKSGTLFGKGKRGAIVEEV
jgi:hypothetical protein